VYKIVELLNIVIDLPGKVLFHWKAIICSLACIVESPVQLTNAVYHSQKNEDKKGKVLWPLSQLWQTRNR
jgi:hypothetical protein